MHLNWASFVTTLASLTFFQNFVCCFEKTYQLHGFITRQTNFRVHVTDGKYFVDKSLFIKDIMEDRAIITSISRPRKFGKSINLSMLYYFLTRDGNYRNLFQGLAITREDRFCNFNQNRHPVILISFAYDTWTTYEQALDGLKAIMNKVFKRNNYLLKGKNVTESDTRYFNSIINKSASHTETQQAISFLMGLMNRFHRKRVILLVDESDVPIRRAYFSGFYDKMVLLMKNTLQKALEKNPHLRKAVLMGTTQSAFEGSFLGINFVEVNTIRSLKYSKYFGFTETEVERMLYAYKCSMQSVKSMREHYGGYFMGNFKMYCPISVALSMKDTGKIILNNFWTKAADPMDFSSIMFSCGILPIIYSEILLRGEGLLLELHSKLELPKIKENDEILWSYLTHVGYLSFSEKATGSSSRTLRLPNKEVALAFNNLVKAYFKEHRNIPKYDTFIESLRIKNSTGIQNCLENYINHSRPFFNGKSLVDFEKLMSRILGGLVKEYGPLTANREGDISTIVLGPSSSSPNQLVFVLKEVKGKDPKPSPVKQVWVKFCSLFKGNETSVVALSLCDGLFELKLKIK